MPEPAASANLFVEQQLDSRISEHEDTFTAHVIAFHGGLLFGVDDVLRSAVEKTAKTSEQKTRGGSYDGRRVH
jgi:hypothetical protein